MNKPTREQIEHRAIEKLLNFQRCEDCLFSGATREECQTNVLCRKALMEKALEEAEKELNRPHLSKKEKEHLREDIDLMEKASGHKYVKIKYVNNGLFFPYVSFYYKRWTPDVGFLQDRYDTISGSPCYTQNLEKDKVYGIQELLDE